MWLFFKYTVLKMKTSLLYSWLVVGMLAFACGCSTDEDWDDLLLDDNTYEKWDGTALPSWLGDRWFDCMLNDLEWWLTESYLAPTLYNVYKFYYKENLLLVLTYDRFSFNQNYYYESGAVCYTDDGRRVKFDKIKDHFEKNAVLLWSNGFDGKRIPQVADYNLGDTEGLGWLQEAIDQICEDIQEPDQLLYQVACGYVHADDATYIVLDCEYFDKNNLNNGKIKIRNIYKPDGEKVTIPEDSIKVQELSSKRIVEILEYLSPGLS